MPDPAQVENINNYYFDGHYKEIWRSFIPEALTKAETDFILQETGLSAGNKVLDLMCGYGRNAIALAKKNIEVVAVDNLHAYIEELSIAAQQDNLPIQCVQADVLSYASNEEFDLVLCMGNSVSFFNQADSGKLFSIVAGNLKKGSRFIFSTWNIAEIAIKNFVAKSWSYVGDIKFLSDSQYLFNPSRIEFETIMITPDGETEIKKGIDYVYSVSETTSMLQAAGLRVKEVYSVPGKKKFALGDLRAYFIAEKI
jgi:2-polyprenyl-3-methyl-5-hydroxy-6-metoxy-1,4-benzoquinol methylase